MPRIPSALAVVAAFAACIGFNVTRYPEVREMAAVSGSSLKFSGPKRPAEAKKPAPAHSDSPTAVSNKPAAAYCTLDGTCYGPDAVQSGGTPAFGQPPAPPVEWPPAPEGLAGPKKSQPPWAEEALVPIVRVVTAPGRPGSQGPRSWPGSGTSGPGPQTPGLKGVERLPPVDRTDSYAPPAAEPPLATDSIPIYSTTAAQ
jgi:hypothetical protein